MVALCLIFTFITAVDVQSQDKMHDKKLEKTKVKKRKKKKDKKAAQYQGKIEPTATPAIKGNPTKKKKTSGSKYQERIGVGKVPKGTDGTRFGGKDKPKSVSKSKGTNYGGKKVSPETKLKGNPTKLDKTSGKNYQDRIGGSKIPRGTEGTNYGGKDRAKTIKSNKGTNYRGEKVELERGVKGNPTKQIGGKKYQERVGNQGPPRGTDGTSFSGTRRPKKIPGGTQGTTYSGQSTAGSTSNAGGRTTIYGERGRNNTGGSAPKIKQQDQGTNWKGDQKAGKREILDYGGDWSGNQKVKRPQQIQDYGGDWSGDQKLRKRRKDTRASTYTLKGYKPKEVLAGQGTTFKGYLKKSKKITGWDGSDYPGELKVNPNKKTKTEGSTFAGHLKVKPNAKIKTPGTNFAGHLKVKPNAKTRTEGTEFAGNLKVRPNAKIKTEGATWRGNTKITTRFFRNRQLRKKSREEQLFAGNYKVRRTKGKDLHPSASYTGRQIRRSAGGKELNRKVKLLLAKTKKNADQPKHLKSKGKKPKYDPKERELWNE